MDTTQALLDMLAFVKEAGELARTNQGHVKISTKLDKTVVTETDIAISKLAAERLAPWLKQPGHVLVDEESIGEATPDKVFASSEYQWVLDPVDGTASYSMGRMGYGISLGLLCKGVPLLGAIYMPAKNELFYTDGVESWRVLKPFTAEETKILLKAQPFEMTNQILVETYFSANLAWGKNFDDGKIFAHRPESAVEGDMMAVSRRAAGSTWAHYSAWDVAAACAIAHNAGFAIRSMEDGRELDYFEASNFKPNWKLKEGWLMCHPDNFDYIRAAILGEEA
jgi:fructose-1,6-bisphosphatase/inositol monophosphatase family enzyme